MELVSDTTYCKGVVSLSFLLAHELLRARVTSFLSPEPPGIDVAMEKVLNKPWEGGRRKGAGS